MNSPLPPHRDNPWGGGLSPPGGMRLFRGPFPRGVSGELRLSHPWTRPPAATWVSGSSCWMTSKTPWRTSWIRPGRGTKELRIHTRRHPIPNKVALCGPRRLAHLKSTLTLTCQRSGFFPRSEPPPPPEVGPSSLSRYLRPPFTSLAPPCSYPRLFARTSPRNFPFLGNGSAACFFSFLFPPFFRKSKDRFIIRSSKTPKPLPFRTD